MISLCDQRIDGIINLKDDGYRIWTTVENITAVDDVDSDDDDDVDSDDDNDVDSDADNDVDSDDNDDDDDVTDIDDGDDYVDVNDNDDEDDVKEDGRSVGMTTTKVVHRIAKLSSAKDLYQEVLDMRNDGEDEFDDDFIDQVQANLTQLRQNQTRYNDINSIN